MCLIKTHKKERNPLIILRNHIDVKTRIVTKSVRLAMFGYSDLLATFEVIFFFVLFSKSFSSMMTIIHYFMHSQTL